MTIQKILFPTDFSFCSDQALREALFLAEQYASELHAVHVTLPLEQERPSASSLLPDLGVIQQQIDQMRERRSRTGPRHYKDIVILQSALRGISAAEALLDYARENDIDLIVMGTHGRRGLKHLMLGSVTEEVVRFSQCPVYTIRETNSARAPHPIRQILVPVDYSEHARIALAHAKSIAADYRATIRALHIIEETIRPSFYVTGRTSSSSWYPEVEAAATSEMKRLFADAPGPDVPAEFHIREGRAPIDIVAFAKRNGIDLIVMASHGLTGIEHFLLGSVAEKVIRMAPCPVFTVKSFGKRLTAPEPERLLSSEK